ncbi:MAG: DNA primase [Holosporaceae bacterium]|jgi:DNA primase|nr:DNA primase [Holosporaceae bacterium]
MDKEFIDFLKEKISILDVVSNKVRMRRTGRDLFGLCPFHREKTPSFKVDTRLGLYHCFGCGAHGDLINFVMETEKIGFTEAVEHLAETHGIPIPHREKEDPHKPIYAAMAEMQSWFSKCLLGAAGEMARQYLESRKISSESLEKFQLGYAASDTELVDYLRKKGFSRDILLRTGVFNRSKYGDQLLNRYNSRLVFPIWDGIGRCVGFGGRILGKSTVAKYINSPETEIFLKSHLLYGYHLAKRGKTREIILVEGYLDVVSLHQAGFDGAVAPLGTSVGEIQVDLCWRVCDNPVISLDGDGAGLTASYRWIDKILPILRPGKSFRFAKLPEESDPASLMADGRLSALEDAIRNAIPLSDWLWEGAFLLYPSETPEQKAAIMKMLRDKLGTIPDASVKRLYIQDVRRRERELYGQKITGGLGKTNIRPVVAVREKLEKIFIVIVLDHPYIMDRIVEHFVKIEFRDFSLRKLRERILGHYEEYVVTNDSRRYSAEMAKLKADMKDTELPVEAMAPEADYEEAVAGWMRLWDRYNMDPLILEDLQMASSSLKSTFSEDDWQRLKALKKEAILNRSKMR